MNGPFVVAQANIGGASATPVQVLKLIKPKAGETDIMHASFTGTVKIDFTAIANEKITLFHDSKNQSLHVIFADGSQIIIEPFFDSRGTIMGNLILEMGPNLFYSGEQFAQTYTISEDPSVLPAAGAGGTAAGADFHDASVDLLGLSNPLGLLGPEELPGLNFTITEAPILLAEGISPVVSGHLQFIVEEEELHVVREQNPEFNTAAGNGNEDTNDVEGDNLSAPPGNDEDVHGDFAITQKQFSGDLSGLVSGGGPFTFFVNNGADGAPVLTQGGVQITSIGDKVVWELHGPNDIWGVTVPDGEGDVERTVFTLHINGDGTFTLTVTDQIDHDPSVGGTPTDDPHHNLFGSLEETIFIDLSIAVGGENSFGLGFTFPTNTLDVGVIDDTPIVKPHASECVTVDEDDIKTHLSHGTSPNDGPHDGSFTGSPFSNGPGPATVCGDLSGLVRVGADAVSIDDCGKPHGTFGFVSEDNLQETLQELGFIGLSSKGYELEYHLEDNGGSQTLFATAASGAEGGYERTVFTLEVFSDGKYEFKLFDQIDHDPPHDFFTDGVSAFPGHDQNFDLQDTVDGDVSKLNFGGLIQFSDYDHDTVGLDGVFEVKIRDDVPEVKCDPICLTVDEDDIVTDQSLGNHPKDGDGDGSSTGSPFNPFDDGPATVIGKLGGLFGVVESGADEPLKFSFITNGCLGEELVEGLATLAGLSSKGEDLSYDIQGNILYAYVNGAGGEAFDAGQDRLVFQFTLQQNGFFKFELFDQVDHDPPNDDWLPLDLADGLSTGPGSEENFDLQDNIPLFDVTSLPLGFLIKATDYDGDSVLIGDNLTIKIRDDVPERAEAPTPVIAIVQEDGLSSAVNEPPVSPPILAFLGNDLSDGNRSGGETTSGDEASGAAGSLASLFVSGADEPLTFGLSNDTSDLPTLFSKGDQVHYLVLGNTLTGFVGLRTVFTLTVNPDGSWSFDLDDQLDHVAGSGDAGFELRTAADGSTHVPSIDFSSVITATDFDHDQVVGAATGSFTIAIENDVPIAKIDATPVTRSVKEDALSTAVDEPPAGAAGNDLSDGNRSGGENTNQDAASGGAGSLSALFLVGADETLTIGMSTNTSGLPILFSKGDQVLYSVSGNALTAYVEQVGGPGFQVGDRVVFTLTVNANGSWTFDLDDQLDHVAGSGDAGSELRTAADGSTHAPSIDFSSIITATDKDGDTVTGAAAGKFTIAVENDIPIAKIDVAAVTTSVKEDALSTTVEPTDSSEGNRSGGENTSQDEASGIAGSLTTLFSAGADEPVVTGISTNTSGLPHLFSKGEAVLYSVSGGTLTAFVDGNANGTFEGTDRTVFTLTVNGDGSWSFDLEDQLDHVAGSGDAGFLLRTSLNDAVGISSIDFSSILTATDKDGDTKTGATAGKFAIAIENDVPIAVNDLDSTGLLASATGNVITGTDFLGGDLNITDGSADNVGADEPGKIIKLDGFNGSTDNSPVGDFTVTGQFGNLVMKENGDYTYTRTSPSSGSDIFTYTFTDFDGDSTTATLTINLDSQGRELNQDGQANVLVEEEQLGHIDQPAFPASFIGNEDINEGPLAPPNADADTDPNPGTSGELGEDFNITTNQKIGGGFNVFGGSGDIDAHFDVAFDNDAVQFKDAPVGPVTSHGDVVRFDVIDSDSLQGYADENGNSDFDLGVDRVVFTVELDNSGSSPSYDFRLWENIDHHAVLAADNQENTRQLDFDGVVVATSTGAPDLALNGTIEVIDDIPVATNNTATVNEGGTASTNFVLILDRSASMLEDPGVPGFATRFALEKAAAINLLNSANVNQVFLVGFSDSASDSGGWVSKAQAIAFITFMGASGQTNYDAALNDAQTAFDYGHTNATQTLAYFLSDGEPNRPFGSVGIDVSEQTAWENFLNTNGVAEAFAVGIGNGATLSTLEPIAYPNGDPNNPIVLTDQSLLADTLIGGLPGVVDGNVLTTNSGSDVDGFGADGPGAGEGIVSITVDGHLYAYNAGTNAITKDGSPFAAGTGTLDLATALGGHLTFHFTSGVGFDAGDWHYQSPNNVPNNSVETFHYVIADGDGDQAGADLSITITANDAPHANFDMVLTNFDGVAFNVPEWALLHNDSDPNGTPIDVTGVLNISDLVVNHTPGVGTNGFITIDDEDAANGGSFDYTISNGTLSDAASVSVSNLNGGGDITGTSAAEILVGDGNGNTFNGAGGGDVILAGAGNDTLIGGGGADYMQGDAGADHFRYNATSEGGVFFNQLGADHILDFSAADSIDILASAFGGGLVAGTDATGPGVFGSSADNTFGSATERFHFNTTTNTLLYDSNGSNAFGTQIALAVLENGGTVGAAQIHMV